MASPLEAYETSRTGAEVGQENEWVGEQVCMLLASQVNGLRPYFDPMYGNTVLWPGASGTFAARLFKYTLEDGGAGRKKLTCWYRKPKPSQLLKPGRAVLYAQLGGHARRLLREETGLKRVIEGPVAGAPNQEWQVVSGTNVVLTPYCTLRLRTASASLALPKFWSLYRKYNSNPLPRFGGAPAKTLLFTGARFTGTLVNRVYWGLDYYFLYRPLDSDGRGWDMGCVVQKKQRVAVKVTPVDAAGAAVAAAGDRYVSGWLPVGAEEDRDVTFGPSNFTAFNAWLSWLP